MRTGSRERAPFTACGMAFGIAAALATPSPARAADCADALRSTCIQSETYWPRAGAAGRFMAIGAAETVTARHMGFGLVTSYQSRPIILRVASPGPTGTDQYAVDNQVTGNFLWAYGVTSRLQLDFVFPVTFIQSGGGTQPITAGAPLQDTAMRDLRFGFAYAFVERARVHVDDAPSVWALTGRLEVAAPTGERDQFAGEKTAVFVPSVAADYRRGRWFAAAEVGFRLRSTAELVGARVGSQAMFGLGVGMDILRRDLLSLALEARALPTFAEQANAKQTAQGLVSEPNGRHITPAEWMLSVRSAPLADGDLTLQLGGGGAIPFGQDSPITTPRFRFVLGIRYAPLGRPKPKADAPPPDAPRPPEAPVDMTPGAAPGAAPIPAQQPATAPNPTPSPSP